MGKSLCRLLYGMLLTMVCLLKMEDGNYAAQYAEIPVELQCVVVSVVLGVLVLFCFLKQKGRIVMVICGIAVCGIVCLVLGTDVVWQTVTEQIVWITIGAWAVGAFLFLLLSERVFLLKAISGIVMVLWLLYDLFWGKSLQHGMVVGILGYVAMVVVEWTQRKWQKKKVQQGRSYLAWMSPFLIGYMVLMFLMPAPEKPYDWQFVKDIAHFCKETFVSVSRNLMYGDREDFDSAVSGFSDEGKLVGSLSESNREVLWVEGQKSLKTNAYLNGKIYDRFDGRQWYAEAEDLEHDRQLDALETAYAIEVYDEDRAGNYIHSTKLGITYRYFNTGYLLAPLKTWKTDTQLLYSGRGADLVWDEKQGYGTTYWTGFFQINVDHPKFYEFLDEVHETDEKIWSRIQKEYIADYRERFPIEALEEHRQKVHEIYGGNVILSETVQSILQQALEGAETDVERLQAIEALLSQMTYTLTPGSLPASVTDETAFLDYFLTESKQGFCSYYATAFVLLARAEGIPARYVEGFCVPMNGSGTVTVTSDMSHAWPEAYIDGVGWIPFEPTPGYEQIRYTPWEMKEKQGAGGGVSLWEMEEEEEEIADTVPVIKQEETPVKRQTGRIVLYALCAVVIIVVLFWIGDGYFSRKRYSGLKDEERFALIQKRNLLMLQMLGYGREAHESLTELKERAYALEQGTGELAFLDVLEEVCYGEYPVTKERLEQAHRGTDILLGLLKQWKPLKYWYCKLVLRY